MKLLITTQKIDADDDILGFFCDWVTEFAKHYEEVRVICLYKGQYRLPANVQVYSLGKEGGVSRFKYIYNFYRILWRERGTYDHVFAHMNQIYVVLGGLWWRMSHKKIGLWYTHRATPFSLRVAEKLAHIIFTAASESFRVTSTKVRAVGHGIDVARFTLPPKERGETIEVLHMGRITPIKNCDVAIAAAEKLGELMPDKKIRLVFAGGPVTAEDESYKVGLEKQASGLKRAQVVFAGAPKFSDVPGFFRDTDVTWNLTPTGGIDKAVLSGLAASRPTLVSNTAFEGIFGRYSGRLVARYRDADDFATKTHDLLRAADLREVLGFLQKKVVDDYSIPGVIEKIVTTLCAL